MRHAAWPDGVCATDGTCLKGLAGRGKHRHAPSERGLAPNLYYRWSKEFFEAGKKRPVWDTTREATSTEVTDLRKENAGLRQLVAEMWSKTACSIKP